MPSPASSTVPVSMTETFWSKPSISLRMIWLISSARICMTSFFPVPCLPLVEQPLAQVGELRAHAAVQHQVADTRDQPADQRRIDRRLQQDLLARALLQRPPH